MEIRIILRGALSGFIAGVLGFTFARIFAEPVINKAIAYESGRDNILAALNKAAGRPVAPDGPEIFSRSIQSTIGTQAPRTIPEGLAALGPFFAVGTHPPGTDPGPPWRPLRELALPAEPLLGRIGSVRRALAASAGRPAEEIPLRVAASITHLGLTARLIAPVLAATAAHRHLDMRLAGLWWQDKLGGPAPLSIPAPGDPGPGQHSNGDPPSGSACHPFLDDVIAPITAATSDLIPVSARVLWGNVASAVNGAANQLAVLRPDLGRHAWAAAAIFFGCPQLSGERQPPGPAFRRSSCCLIYQLAPDQTASICGDCILDAAHSRRRRAAGDTW